MITRVARIAVRWPVPVLAVWGAIVLVLTSIGLPNVQKHLLPADLFVPGTQSFSWNKLKSPNYGENIALEMSGPAAALDRYGPRLNNALATRPLTRVQSPWSPGASPAVAKILRPQPGVAVMAMDIRQGPGLNSSTMVPPLERFIGNHLPRSSGIQWGISGDSPLGRELNNAGFEALHQGEIIAVPLLVIILLLVFRSPVAAAIPLIIAGGTLGAGMGILDLFTNFMNLAIMSLSLLSMIGLALGVDYALLLVSRFREALESGHGTRQAATLATNTAGRTAVFAGCVLSALMLSVIILSPGPVLGSAAVGAIISTIFAMVSGLVVVPAMLVLLGPRVNKWQIGGRGTKEGALIPKVVRGVSSRPALSFALVLAALLALASPVLALKATPPDPRELPGGNPALVSYDHIRQAGLGPNINIVLRKPNGDAITSLQDLNQIQNLENDLGRVPNISFVAGPGLIDARARMLAQAPAQIRAARRELNHAHQTLSAKINQVNSAQSLLASDKTKLSNGLNQAQGMLNRAQAMLNSVGGQAGSQFGQLVTGLGAAAAGAGQLGSGAQTLQANAGLLAQATALMSRDVNALGPEVHNADRQIRAAQAALDLLRVPAQVTQRELQSASVDLAAVTVGNADPAVQKAKVDIAAALAADSGNSPLGGGKAVPGYAGLDGSLAEAAQRANIAGNRADYAVRAYGYAVDAVMRLADGAARLASPGLTTLVAGLHQLAAGLALAHNKVAAAAPQVAALESNARAMIAEGQSELNAAAAQAFPQLADAQGQLVQAGNQLATVRHQLVSRTGPFRPLREIDAVETQSPFLWQSPYLIVAALQGTRPVTRSTSETLVDSGTGGNVGQIVMLPNVQTNSPAQDHVVSNVRALTGQFTRQNHFLAAVGGSAAELVDFRDAYSTRVPIIIAALCIITYLLLVPILRSLVLPAIAVTLNVLTVAVAMGIVTCATVSGVLFDPAPVGGAGKPDILAVTAVFCVIFALSIDYYVFLLTRMREEYVRTQSNTQAVLFGIEKTGRIVTGAALIMIGTFFAFALANFSIVQELGIGLTSAILVDATLVRLGLLPAVMRLFGDWTWWMPKWLDDRLPTFDIEGTAFEHEAEQITGRPAGAAGFA